MLRRAEDPAVHAVSDQRKLEILAEYVDAWNRRDLDRVMALMSEECSYHPSAVFERDKTAYVGRAEVERAILRFLERFREGGYVDTRAFVAGDRGAAQWTWRGVDRDGNSVEIHGCDFYEFDGDRITRKDSYRKVRDIR